MTTELDELAARLRVHDEETTRRLAMLRAEFDVARSDLDTITLSGPPSRLIDADFRVQIRI